MPTEPVVYIIDDDDAVRESLQFLLDAAGIKVEAYESATAFLPFLEQIRSGCIITDVRMPEVTGIDLLKRVKDVNSDIPVIVITGHGDVPLAVEAMKIGAADFLEKPFEHKLLLELVRAALARNLSTGKRNAELDEINDRLATLSARERQVLEGLVAGKPNKIVAYDLGISARTVEIHRAHVMTKMQANSLSALVRMSMVAGIIEGVSES